MNNPDLTTPKHQVKFRGGYADRTGVIPINTKIQNKSIDTRTRTILNSFILGIINDYEENIQYESQLTSLVQFVNRTFLYLYEIDYKLNPDPYERINSLNYFRDTIASTIQKDRFEGVFTLIEFFSKNLDILSPEITISFDHTINNIFKGEYVGYRLLKSVITPITDEIEITSIQKSLNNPYESVSMHTGKALEKLSNRENPDYENSIKESILSVEAMLQIILSETETTEKSKKPSLGKALNIIKKEGLYIHPALEAAFHKLYGFTSDQDGIRHAGNDNQKSTFAEAQFMLITCSAFTNYLLINQSEYVKK